MIVDLTEEEWRAVIACMSYAPARESVPYMNKIGAQVQKQQTDVLHPKKNSEEMPINIGEMGAKQ